MPLCEHVAEDYVTTGLSLKEHPISFFREQLARLGVIRNAELRNEALPQDRRITVAGLVLTRQMPGAKGVVFVTLEDETDIANIIVWPKVFARNRRTVMNSRFLAVRGRLQRAGLVVHVLAENFIDLSAELPRLYGDDLLSDLPLLKSRDFIEPSAAQPPGSVPIRASASSLRAYWLMYQPPLGETTWPVMNFASSLAR
jgi:error-prone DNA polymerase